MFHVIEASNNQSSMNSNNSCQIRSYSATRCDNLDESFSRLSTRKRQRTSRKDRIAAAASGLSASDIVNCVDDDTLQSSFSMTDSVSTAAAFSRQVTPDPEDIPTLERLSITEATFPMIRSFTPESIKRQRVQFAEAPIVTTATATTAAPTATLVVVPDDNTATTATATTAWYTPHDYATFRKNAKRDVLHMTFAARENQMAQLDFAEVSVVGLEKYCCSSSDIDQMRDERKRLVQAVLDQQCLQKVLGVNDPEMILMMSQVHTHTASQKAQDRARAVPL